MDNCRSQAVARWKHMSEDDKSAFKAFFFQRYATSSSLQSGCQDAVDRDDGEDKNVPNPSVLEKELACSDWPIDPFHVMTQLRKDRAGQWALGLGFLKFDTRSWV